MNGEGSFKVSRNQSLSCTGNQSAQGVFTIDFLITGKNQAELEFTSIYSQCSGGNSVPPCSSKKIGSMDRYIGD